MIFAVIQLLYCVSTASFSRCGTVELAVPTMDMIRAEFKMVDELQARHDKHDRHDRLAPE